MLQKINIFWFRRDLRINDNTGLYHALQAGLPVLPIFILDKDILDELENKNDARVNFIYNAVLDLKDKIEEAGGTLIIKYGRPIKIFEQLIKEYSVNTVFTNNDYEPYAISRDLSVKHFLEQNKVSFKSFKDQVIFERDEVIKDNGTPYLVFTPYSKKWLSELNKKNLVAFPSEKLKTAFLKMSPQSPNAFNETGFFLQKENIAFSINETIILDYDKTRNFPSIEGTSHLGVHLRFGTISIRYLAAKALELNKAFLNELIWREFFMQLLWRYPRLVNESFKREYDHINWRNNEMEFEKWRNGMTGFPIVDAGMRQLNETGFMHNRVRMITASFLVKHLLIDWRWGEAYFASKLLDYELAANNGNWQWVAGCGCDAAPYFRIFNPVIQTKKFDPDLKYISRWVPELNSFDYPNPIVDHEMARERCLIAYKKALQVKV